MKIRTLVGALVAGMLVATALVGACTPRDAAAPAASARSTPESLICVEQAISPAPCALAVRAPQ
jgi:hypothetical protein